MTETQTDIKSLLTSQYSMDTPCITRLAGENENYLVTGPNTRHVLKLADQNTGTGMIEIEHLAVESIINAGIFIDLPRVVPTRNNEIEARYQAPNEKIIRGRARASYWRNICSRICLRHLSSMMLMEGRC